MIEMGWLTIRELEKYQGCIFMWNMLHLSKPGNLRDKLEIEEEWRLIENRPRLIFTQRCLRWKITEIWNSLEYEIRKESKLNCFKKLLKRWIVSRRNQDPD